MEIKINLHFIHGFLGLPSDWNFISNLFPSCRSVFYSIDEFIPSYQVNNYFEHWSKEFNQKVFHNNKKSKAEKNILIGYSLGGRLALHSLLQKNYWDEAVIISANPGLLTEEEKEIRILNDKKWGQRFLNEPWENVMSAWNSQGVFSQQKSSFIRHENLYDKKNIYKQLVEFSLGNQENLRPFIQSLTIPVTWISGELDRKFALMGEEMQRLNKNIQNINVKKAGHRVPWENTEEFIEILKKIVK